MSCSEMTGRVHFLSSLTFNLVYEYIHWNVDLEPYLLRYVTEGVYGMRLLHSVSLCLPIVYHWRNVILNYSENEGRNA